MSSRFAEKGDTISRRHHISATPAHTLVAQACLGILLHLDKNITRNSLIKFPLAEYAAEHWFEHARFEGVSQNSGDGMKQLFDRRKSHFAVWLWIYDPTKPYGNTSARCPVAPRETALHYASFCGLNEIVKVLVIEHPEDVNSGSFHMRSTPLHLASKEGHVEVVRALIGHGADAAARTEDGSTPLHEASSGGHMDVVQFLIEHGTDAAARTEDGSTPLHWASFRGHMDVAQFLIEHGADAAAWTEDGSTPLHAASLNGHADVAQFLIEYGADVAA